MFEFFTGESAPKTAFIMQFVNADAKCLAASLADYVFVDADAFTREEVSIIRAGRKGRHVIAYLSVGEAENYRSYWPRIKDAVFVRAANPAWPDNFKVDFWEVGWQCGVLVPLVDAALDKGFDGVFLDVVDAFEESGTAAQMAKLVHDLALYARRSHPDFLIIPNGGEALLDEDGYAGIISGIVKEDVFYGVDGDSRPNDSEQTAQVLSDLENFSKVTRKPVFVIEYLRLCDKAQRNTARNACTDLGFKLSVPTSRALDSPFLSIT